MEALKQSTASQVTTIGPFVDDVDFKALEDGLTIANTDIKLKKNGATAVNKNSGGGTSDVHGMYAITFDATDTGTVGNLRVSVKVAGALVVWKDFWVFEEAVFDLLYPAAATGKVTVAALDADVITAASIAANAITAAKINAAAFTAVKFGADFITAAKIAPDACQQFAAHVHRITIANIESDGSADAIADGVPSAYNIPSAYALKYDVVGSDIVIKKNDGTSIGKRPITVNANTQIITIGKMIAS